MVIGQTNCGINTSLPTVLETMVECLLFDVYAGLGVKFNVMTSFMIVEITFEYNKIIKIKILKFHYKFIYKIE